MPFLVDYQTLEDMAFTDDEFNWVKNLAIGQDYITTTSTTAVNVEISPLQTETLILDNSGSWATVQSTYTTKERTIDDIVNEKIEQYKELMRLQALGCKNCGGSINRDTMVCDYCGTRYRN